MPKRWRRCAATILTTGSIFSTYGAISAAPDCLAPPPTDAAQLVAGLALPGQRVRYREEVRHPALAEPEVATGTMLVTKDGDLVRDQVTPERQISEIGETMLSTRRAPDAEPTLYPIPAAARPMLLAMRRMLAGDGPALAADFAAELTVGQAGWRLALRPRAGDAAAIAFGGCGADLRTMEIAEPGGVRRSLAFSPAR